MEITGYAVVWIAVSAGSSHSMVSNVMVRSSLMVLRTLLQTTAKQTPTYTEQLRLVDTAREFPREQSEWE